ncbi:MAG: 3-dehydroquinate synthase family protein [Candidatus Baltobacteraceae bacterium]
MDTQEEDRDRALASAFNEDLGYPIVVGDDLLGQVATFARGHGGAAAILCDANRHVRALADRVAATAGKTPVLAFRLGESRKRLATLESVLDAMLEAGVERGRLVIGIGGGVASDLFGFAGATYMRGVPYAHVATSLVAMVDAAIGGKTGLDLRGGKNLAGSFRDPVGVFCDVDALRSLPARALREGLAEIVKAAVIEGGEFFEDLEVLAGHRLRTWRWSEVIASAIKVKTMVVAEDRLEAGPRERLNLGHTFAHAIERTSGYRVTHGAAVSLGLRAAGALALQTGRFSEREHLRVLTLLTLLGLPLQTTLPPDEILAAMHSDKKRRAGRLRFVLPRAIGDVEYGVEASDRSVRAVLARLQRPPESFRARR